jgi:hypothetical protein
MKTDKIIVLFVLALLVFSVPVFAQDATDTTGTGDASTVQSGSQIDNIHDKIQTINEAGGNANLRFKTARDAIKSGETEILACKNLNNADCETKRAAYVQQQKEYLNAVRDKIEANLDLIDYYAKNYIQDSENRAQVVDHVKDIKAQLNEIYANMKNVQTLEEAKDIRDKLQVKFKEIRDAIKQYNVETQRAKLYDVNARLLTLNAKVNHAIDKLESKGINLGSEYPAKIEALNVALASAQENLDLARTTYSQALSASGTEREQLIQQAQNYADKAREDIKNVKNKLQDLIQTIRSNAGNQEFAQAITQA